MGLRFFLKKIFGMIEFVKCQRHKGFDRLNFNKSFQSFAFWNCKLGPKFTEIQQENRGYIDILQTNSVFEEC